MSETSAPDAHHYAVKSMFDGHEVGTRLSKAEGEAAIEKHHEHQMVRVSGPLPSDIPAPAEEK